MNRRGVTALAALAVLWAAGGAVRAEAPEAGSSVTPHTFESASLGRESAYKLYLPAGERERAKGLPVGPKRALPVILALHGLGGSGRDWFSEGGGQLAPELDAAIAEGRLPSVALLAPNGDNGYWTDHVGGRAGTAFGALIQEALGVAAARHGLDTSRVVIAGVSMGGHGAMSAALRDPGRYRAVVTLAGALFDTPPDHRPVYLQVWGEPVDRDHWARTAPSALYATPGLAQRAPPIWLHYGERDDARFVRWNRHAIAELTRRGYRLTTAVDDGSHGWVYWRPHTRAWLEWVAPFLRGERSGPHPSATATSP